MNRHPIFLITLLSVFALGGCSKEATPPTAAVPVAPTAATAATAPIPATATLPAAPPPAAPPASVPPAVRAVAYGGIEFDIPLAWKSVQAENSMRLAQFEVAGKGKSVAELVVFYFPPGRGGSQQDNIARWASQFTDDKGGRAHPDGRMTVVNNMAVTRVELNGNYSRGVGMGTEGNVKPNQTLLVAIITTPLQGNVTLHFFGSKALVQQNRERFEALLNSIRFKG